MLELPDPLFSRTGKAIVAGASPSCCLNMNSRGIAFLTSREIACLSEIQMIQEV